MASFLAWARNHLSREIKRILAVVSFSEDAPSAFHIASCK
jgi:hypothetical protein